MSLRVPAALTAIVVLMIAAPALAAEGEVKRAASGRPDLTGNYDAATLTPLQRPEEYGENLFLTREGAEKIEADAAKLRADRHQVSDPNRKPPPVGGDGTTGGAGNVGGYNRFWVDPGTEAFSVDGKFRTSILTDPPNGRIPEMTEAGKARAAERARLRRPNDGSAWWLEIDGHGPYDGPETLPVTERCIVGFTGATPTFPSLYNNFKRVVQTENHVMILIEMVHDARIVRLNSEHPSPEERKWLGDSIGWWEGDTLVIDSVNFHPKTFLRGSPPRSFTSRNASRFSRTATSSTGSRWTTRPPGRRPGPASTSGGTDRNSSTSTPATRATTRWATRCAAREFSRPTCWPVRPPAPAPAAATDRTP